MAMGRSTVTGHDRRLLPKLLGGSYFMNRQNIINKIQIIISDILQEETVVDESIVLREIGEDRISLGLSSLDMMDLIIQIETEFGIEIEPESYPTLYDVGSLVQKVFDSLELGTSSDLDEIEKDLFD